MRTRVTIRLHPSKGLAFEVSALRGEVLARSDAFDSICRLEAALGTLHGANAQSLAVEATSTATTVTVGTTRRRVRFLGRLTRSQVEAVVAAVRDAVIVDERPAHRRRQDLSGMHCDLTH